MFQDSNFDVLDDDMEDVEGETIHTTTTGVSTVSTPVITAGVAISTAEPRTPLTTATTAFIDEDLTIAQTLIKMKEDKGKEKGVVIKDVEDSLRPIRSITTLQPLPTIDPKDKGKGVLVEEEPEKPEKVKKKGSRFDEIQARIDADHKLAVRLTHEEQEKYTIEERARLLAKVFERRKKQLATERKLEEDNDAEKEELRDSMDVVPRDDTAIDVESLATKYPIVDWQTLILNENMMYYQIIRADGSSKNYKIFSEMLDDFDRQDVIDLHRMSDTKLRLDEANMLCFQLGGARCTMNWRQFIFALGLHNVEEMEEDGFEAYYISGRGQTPEKVTATDLFYLRSMNQGMANVPYLLVLYLFRHAKGRKSKAKMSKGHFIRRLAEHFRLVSNVIDLDELVKLKICVRLGDTWVASGPERQPDVVAGAPEAPQPPVAAQGRIMLQRLARLEEEVHGLRGSMAEVGSGTRAILIIRFHTRGAPGVGMETPAP
ncbi:hypothetical protein Tco_1525719 [Tanacetum coccineum]